MNANHLSENEVQQYASGEAGADETITAHITMCESCSARAANYRLLFAEIAQQPKPAFGFDVAQMVLAQLPQPQKFRLANNLVVYIAYALAFVVLGVLAWVFRKDLYLLFYGISTMAICLMAVPLAGIIAAEGYGMYKKYKKQMHLLA